MMSANLRAFLAMIRWAEGTSGPDGYQTLVGGKLFDSFDDHPRKIQTIRFGQQEIHSSAAGAYQFLANTWDRCRKALDLPDFSPESQDKAAVYLIQQRGALLDVEQGRLREALEKCSWEWASLPPSRYNQPTKSVEACEVIFERAGGILSQPAGATPQGSVSPTPSPAPAPAAPSPGGIMAIPALVTAAASALLPIIADLFRARGSKTATRNAEILDQVGDAAPAIVEIAKTVSGAQTGEQAAEAILASKELQQQFRAQVALNWDEIAKAMDVIGKAAEIDRADMDAAAERSIKLGAMPFEKLLPFYLIAIGQFILTLSVASGLGWAVHYVVKASAEGKQIAELPSWASMIVGSLLIVIALEWRSIILFVTGRNQGSSVKDAIVSRVAAEEQAKR